MAPTKVQNKYYGGDDYDEKDEESIKLFIKDCHQRQMALNSIDPYPNSPVSYFLTPLSKGELLYVSGQSRFQHYLREGSDSKDILDFILFKRSDVIVPPFPQTLEEEARAFRSHGLPLLVWPKNKDKATVQKYLEDNYPDCAVWFKELDKCQTWLNEKWLPLAKYLGLTTSQDTKPLCPVLRDLSSDCIARTFVCERIDWLFRYCSLMESYLLQRRMAVPGFHHNPIHKQLRYFQGERQKLVANDAGFFNVAGNRLLQLGEMAVVQGKTVKLHIHKMATQIVDVQQRVHFLSVLLPMKDLKTALTTKNFDEERRKNEEFTEAKAALIEALEEDSEELSPESSDDERMKLEDEEDVKLEDEDKGLSMPPVIIYPNRPVSKEIMENRGVVKYRHKRERNPRVHNRYKYRKALIRYKSRVPQVRKEIVPYVGEARGIRAHMIRSQQFKKKK